MKNFFLFLISICVFFTNSCFREERLKNVSQNNKSRIVTMINPSTNEEIEFFTINNPNKLVHTGRPRDEKVVKDELEKSFQLSLYIEDYTNSNGLEKTVNEINKGRDGELAKYMPDTFFYLSFSENIIGEAPRTIIAHATLPSAIGFTIPELSMIKDNTGWAYNGHIQGVLEAENYNRGLIENLIWTDPVWSYYSCRMKAYYTLFNYEGKEYNLYYAIWLDE
jgi:hypothetical protein